MPKTFVIAEVGSNHNNDLQQAKALIDVAVEAGADAVKFQVFKSTSLYTTSAKTVSGIDDIHELMTPHEISESLLTSIVEYCNEVDIEFMATPFDEESLDMIIKLGVKRIKVAGFEGTDSRFIDMVSRTGLPLIVSLGVGSTMHDIHNILYRAEMNGCTDITFLHCNNGYPTPINDASLDRIEFIKYHIKKLNSKAKVGFSDHTVDARTPALAVAKGATVIEKHYTLSRRLTGPDHAFAMEPSELKEMVQHIRFAEQAVKYNPNSIMTNSAAKHKEAQRSLVALKKISTGDVLTTDNVTTKRPYYDGKSIHARDYYDYVVNPNDVESLRAYVATRDIEVDEMIGFTDLKSRMTIGANT